MNWTGGVLNQFKRKSGRKAKERWKIEENIKKRQQMRLMQNDQNLANGMISRDPVKKMFPFKRSRYFATNYRDHTCHQEAANNHRFEEPSEASLSVGLLSDQNSVRSL